MKKNMGLDQHIVMAHNKKELESNYVEYIDARGMDEFDYSQPAELWYNRKIASKQESSDKKDGK